MTRVLTTSLALLLATAAPRLAPAQDAKVQPRAWEHEHSDVPADPRIHFGALDNGLRWAWLANPEPKQRCYLRLHVDVGSLGEDESERGMAHFLEHMAFNGSKNFKPGTLIEWLQKRGLDFGADSNASTNFSETVYMLDLPTSDEASVREGLLVMSDFAGRLDLSQEEIDAEKGVIDGEERERDSAAARVGIKALKEFYAGARIAERIPIGLKPARDAFTSKSIRTFYEHWYRPDAMTLVVVGDLGTLDPVPLIKELFGDLPVPKAPRPQEPPLGEPRYDKPFYVLYDSEVPTATIELSRYVPWKDEATDKATIVANLPLEVANDMLNLRFAEKSRTGKASFLAAGVGRQRLLHTVDGVGLGINCEPAKWKAALAEAEQELRRAVEFGFDDVELDEVRKDRKRSLDEAVEREKTRSSGSYAAEIVDAAEERTVPSAAETDRKIIGPALAKLDVAACHAALKEAWSKGKATVQLTGGVDLGADGPAQLQAAYEASLKVEVAPRMKAEQKGFAYESDPKKLGAVKEKSSDEASGVDRIVLENGVVVLLKKTDFKARQILVAAAVGEGGLASDPAEDVALRFIARSSFIAGGLGKHDVDELRRLFAGKQADVGFEIADDHFEFGGATTREDLLTMLETACAYLTDPGYRPDGVLQLQRQVPQLFEFLAHSLDGPLVRTFNVELWGGDRRYAFPTEEALAAVDVAKVKAWLQPQLDGAPITLCVVGDFDVDATESAVRRTFGVLPPRRARDPHDDRRAIPPMKEGLRTAELIDSEIPKGMVYTVLSTDDGMEPARRRNLSFLARVLNDRVRIAIREKLGASYSPVVQGDSSLLFPHHGSMAIRAECSPDAKDALAEGCLAVVKELGEKGVTDEEIERLRTPLLKDLRDKQRDNMYWLRQMVEMHSRPHALEEMRTAIDHYEHLEKAKLDALAAKYLKPEKASMLVVLPKPSASTDKAPANPPGGK